MCKCKCKCAAGGVSNVGEPAANAHECWLRVVGMRVRGAVGDVHVRLWVGRVSGARLECWVCRRVSWRTAGYADTAGVDGTAARVHVGDDDG